MTAREYDDAPRLFRQRVTHAEANLSRDILAGLHWRPLFRLIMPIDDSDDAVDRCRATLASLDRQIFRHWNLRLILRYRDSDFGRIVERLREGRDTIGSLRDRLLQPRDSDRLRDRLLADYGHLADRVCLASWAEGDQLADLASAEKTGPSYIAILRAGDELSCDALSEFAITGGLDRAAEFIYSDEERPNRATGAVEAYCKADWSPDLILSTNYIGRLWCAVPALLARAELTIGDLLRYGEYELVLRATEAARGIRHVPSVLCRRWGDELDSRMLEEQALKRALNRRGIDGEVESGCAEGFYRVRRAVADGRRVSVIIPTCGARDLYKTCIETLRNITTGVELEVIVIDDIPAENRAAKTWLHLHADRVIPAEPPFNWSRYNNVGAAAASGDFLLFLNDDIEITEPGWLTAMLEHAQRPEVGVVGPQLLYPNGTVQHAGMFLAAMGVARHISRGRGRDELGYFGLARTQRNVSAVTGACLMSRREVFRQLGGFDEAHDIVNNDLDYCLQVQRHGLLCVFTPHASLIHHEGATRAQLPDHYAEARFAQRWRPNFTRGDPYHHPALSRGSDDLTVDQEQVETLCSGHPVFDPDSIREILVVKLDHIGDCIGAVPAIERLKTHFPAARITVMSGAWAMPIWALVPAIDRKIEFSFFNEDSSSRPPVLRRADLEALERQLLAYRFDLAVDLRRQPETRSLLRYTGARYMAGFDDRSRFPWLDITLEWEGDQARVRKRQHFGDSLVNLVDAIAFAGHPERTVLNLDASGAFARVAAAPVPARPLVCVHPAAGSAMRRWPAAHFAELIDMLIEEDDVDVVLIGSADEQPVAAAVLKELRNRERVSSAMGTIPMGELPGFLAGCVLFVGNNSGPEHIAAGIGVPTVGIHSGNVDAQEWGPMGRHAVAVRRDVECAPCYLAKPSDCPRALACLADLQPRDVYRACRRLLAIGRARRYPRVSANG